MEKSTTSRLDPRAALIVVALALVVAAVWAATALAGGSAQSGSAGAGSSDGGARLSSLVDESAPGTPLAEDCPERGGSASAARNDRSDDV